jgi:uncharacterized protein (DUF1015 family)
MPRISPFVGLRFDVSRVGSPDVVTAPPYDVISPAEHERYLAASPYNVIRLDLGHDPARPEGAERYEQAARDLDAWRRQGALVPVDGPSYFVYEMRFRHRGRARRIRGLVGAVELEDWGAGIVPHERTMPGPIDDRLRLMRALRTNLSCIYAVFRGPREDLASWLDGVADAEPDVGIADEDGVEHRLWAAPPDPRVGSWLGDESLMIADGHHRYATALRFRDEMRAEHGSGPWDRAMMLVVDAEVEEPPVLPFHRIQRDGDVPPGGTTVRDLEEVLDSVDDGKLLFGLAVRDRGRLTHRVLELEGEPPAVSRLHEQYLAGRDADLRFTPDALTAEEAVRGGEAAAAYFLPPTDAGTIRSVVDRGGRLPQKSTFFWPKPRTGLVLLPHDLN